MADSEDRYQAEDRAEVFQPDVLLPKQYFDALKRKKYPTGEHRLLVAILRDAVECFQKYMHATDNKRRQLYLDAEAWIESAEDQGQFSFNHVSELLGMNADYVREGLLQWRDLEQARERQACQKKEAEAVLREVEANERSPMAFTLEDGAFSTSPLRAAR